MGYLGRAAGIGKPLAALLALMLGSACETSAPPPLEWRSAAAASVAAEDIAGLSALAEAFPHSGSVRLRLLNALLAAEDFEAAYGEIVWLVERGYAFSAGAEGQLAAMYEGERAARLVTLFAQDPLPLATSEVIAQVHADASLVEAALWDREYARMYATSIVPRGLLVGEPAWRDAGLADAGSLAGIAIDAERNLVWLGSGVVDPTPDPATAFRGLIALDRESLEERRRLPLPEGASASDIAVGPDGAVYASDPVHGGVWVSGGAAMWALVPEGALRSPQGLAVSADNRLLYVSDYRYGIAIVDLASQEVSQLSTGLPILLDGADGLWLHEGELIAVRNGTSPMQIVAWRLSPDGREIVGARVLERANPDWTEPLGGSITDGALYYIGNGNWDLFGADGQPVAQAEWRTAQIRRLELADIPAD